MSIILHTAAGDTNCYNQASRTMGKPRHPLRATVDENYSKQLSQPVNELVTCTRRPRRDQLSFKARSSACQGSMTPSHVP